jgi:hypothetical protein
MQQEVLVFRYRARRLRQVVSFPVHSMPALLYTRLILSRECFLTVLQLTWLLVYLVETLAPFVTAQLLQFSQSTQFAQPLQLL